ncbi:MAG: hypothetical protein ACLFTJ_11590 [Halothece sp.]
MSSQYTHKKFKITQPDPNSELGKQDQERINYFQKNKERINQRFDQARQNFVNKMDLSHHGSLETEEEIVEASLKITR